MRRAEELELAYAKAAATLSKLAMERAAQPMALAVVATGGVRETSIWPR